MNHSENQASVGDVVSRVTDELVEDVRVRVNQFKKEIKTDVLQALTHDGLTFIDLRPQDLYMKGHIRMAINIPELSTIWNDMSREQQIHLLRKYFVGDIIKYSIDSGNTEKTHLKHHLGSYPISHKKTPHLLGEIKGSVS